MQIKFVMSCGEKLKIKKKKKEEEEEEKGERKKVSQLADALSPVNHRGLHQD